MVGLVLSRHHPSSSDRAVAKINVNVNPSISKLSLGNNVNVMFLCKEKDIYIHEVLANYLNMLESP